MRIKLGLVNIEVMNINLFNSKYSNTELHQFSNCCKSPVRYKKVCESCQVELTQDLILKGTDKDTILTEEQQDRLKELLETSVIEILSINDLKENTLTDLLPFVVKAQIILPSIRKGFKKSELIVFYSFKKALEELNKFCICKMVLKAKEHLCILINYKTDLILLEIPFSELNNKEEIDRLKEAVNFESKNLNLEQFKEQAKKFISDFENQYSTFIDVKEEKKQLLKEFVEQIRSGNLIPSSKEKRTEIENPFLTKKEKKKKEVKNDINS